LEKVSVKVLAKALGATAGQGGEIEEKTEKTLASPHSVAPQ
jgi:hypothetical protein